MKKKHALVVGGDARYMQSFFKLLRERGFLVEHDDGRGRKSQLRKKLTIPQRVSLLVVVTNYGGHNVIQNYINLGKQTGVKMIYCRLSTIELAEKLEGCLCINRNAGLTRDSYPT
jgi:hypothetical protein